MKAVADRRREGLCLLAILILCLPPLLVGQRGRPPYEFMESVSVLSSQETWMAVHAGQPDAWLTPTLRGSPRIRKPPLLVWVNLLAWTGLKPGETSADELLWRARLVCVGMGLVIVVATWGIGRLIAGPPFGLVAAAASGLALLMANGARRASYDIHLAFWCSLALLSGIWALQSFSATPIRGRTILGWIGCGLFTTCAMLTKGPITLVFTVVPLALACMMLAPRRGRALGCAALAHLGAMLAVSPWYLHVFRSNERAPEVLADELEGVSSNTLRDLDFYVTALARYDTPWTLWLICGLVVPFLVRRTGERTAWRFPAIWLGVTVIIMSLHPSKDLRYIVPLVPALGLVAAAGLTATKPVDGSSSRVQRGLFAFHWLIWLGASIVPFLAAQSDVASTVEHYRAICIAVGIALAALAAVGLWRAIARPMVCTLVALTLLWATVFHPWYLNRPSNQPTGSELARNAAREIRRIVGDQPLAWLRMHSKDTPSYEFLFYLERVVNTRSVKQVQQAPPDDAPPVEYLMADADDPHDQTLREAGYQPVLDFQYSRNWPKRSPSRLWVIHRPTTGRDD